MRDETILITGGCGFIGANLIPVLLDAGAHVRVLDDLSRGDAGYLDPGRTTIVRGDVRDPDAVARATAGVDAVVHLAAYGSVVESVSDPETNFAVNALGTLRVLEGARDANVRRVIFASTGGALMGNTPPPVNEASVPRPISPYGASKLAGEAYCHAFAESYGLDTVMLRFGNVYGPWSAHKKGAVTGFIRALLADEPIVIYGDGSASRDFLHVADLCDGILRALGTALPRASILHLASSQETTVAELAEMLKTIAGKPEHPVVHRAGRTGEVGRNFADSAAAQRHLGFRARWGLRDGLRQTWEWFAADPKRLFETTPVAS